MTRPGHLRLKLVLLSCCIPALLAALRLVTGPLYAQIAATTATAPAVQVIERSAPPTVGTEGRLDVVLPVDDLAPVVASSKANIVVRVAERRQWGTGWRYDLRWVAAVPGKHDLVKYLRREEQPDAPLSLDPLLVEATSILPQAHDGSLANVGDSRVGGARWYWPVAAALALVWVLLLVPLIRSRFRRKTAPVPQPSARPLTLAERLRPLVAAAAAGRLNVDGRGRLERLLLQFWRQRLGLGEVPVAAALVQMKSHPQAGQILNAMEDWLHRPPDQHRLSEAELARLLEPYASVSDDTATQSAPAEAVR